MSVYLINNQTPKFVFIINYKVMFSTLKNIVPIHFPKVEFYDKEKVANIDFKEFQVFSIVRNPYHRAVSFYADKCSRNPMVQTKMTSAFLQYCQKQLLEALMELRGTKFKIAPPGQSFTMLEHPIQRYLLNENFMILKNLDFEEYIHCIPLILNKKSIDGHFTKQYDAFIIRNKKLYNFKNHFNQPINIYKMESIDQDWSSIQQAINAKILLKRSNATFIKNKDDYYTQKTRKIIHKAYQIDFEQFGYSYN